MSTRDEIMALEERVRQAELVSDPEFFEQFLADEVLIDGKRAKEKIVTTHRPGGGLKFTKVEMRDFEIVDHGDAAVVTCTGSYEGPQWSGTLKFMRVWLRHDGRWQIIAGSVLH